MSLYDNIKRHWFEVGIIATSIAIEWYWCFS